MDNIEEVLDQSRVDISNSGLRCYYLHPEDRTKYISFPVTHLAVSPMEGIPKTGLSQCSMTFDQIMSVQFAQANFYPEISDEALDLFTRYGVEDYIDDYYVGCFTEHNEYANKIMFKDYYTEWDSEEKGELQIWSWRSTDSADKSPLAPYERYTDHESFTVKTS